MSKAKNKEEIREEFIAYIRDLVHYWDEESRAKTSREKLDGLAFSILNVLDGNAAELPGFEVKAIGTEENIEYSKEKNEDYYPLEGEDIAGRLHELYYWKLD